MRTRKILFTALFVALTGIAIPASAGVKGSAPIFATKAVKNNAKDDARAQELLARLREIKSMDRSTMTKAEKKELRKEVRETKKEMRYIRGGIYLSAGAVLLVALLLILLL